MKGKLELRFQKEGIRVAETGDDNTKLGVIEGYAARYNETYEDDYFIETIIPGAFTRAIREKHDVRALVDHDSTLVLGRTKSGTLSLSEDEKGLFSKIDIPDTSYARDLRAKMIRGDVDGMSFGFIVRDQRWGTKGKKFYREILDLDLFDVSVVTYPAYSSTSAGLRAEMRSLEDILESARAAIAEQTRGVDAFHADLEKYLASLERL